MDKKVVFLGAGGHGLVLADIAKLNGYNEIIFLDDVETVYPYKISGTMKDIRKYVDIYDFFISIGDNRSRSVIANKVREAHGHIVNLIHPKSVIATDVKMGEGIAVMANVVINSGTEIGDGCILNTSCSVDHENRIKEFVHISPGCHLSGNVQIGNKSWLGTGCNVVNNITICKDSVIGAGSVVIQDIEEPGTYVGVPAKKIK